MSDKPKVLVTGGTGYIGSYCVRMLSQQGYRVVVLDNLVYGHRQSIDENIVQFVEGDIRDDALVDSILGTGDIAAVMHFAAYAYVGESVKDPSRYYDNNVAASLALLRSMLRNNVKRFIFSSTCATYGNPEYVPIDEKHPQHPINPYGTSKLMLEMMLRDFAAAYGFTYAFLRYFNASGAAEDGSIGEDHNPETHLIPLALQAITGERGALTVFGDDYDTPDGTCIRDYIHIHDLARAHLMALDRLVDGEKPIIANLGTGIGASVLEVIRTAEKVAGKPCPHSIGSRREGDPPQLVAQASHAIDVLGWKAEITDLEDIIRSAWKWMTGPRAGHYRD